MRYFLYAVMFFTLIGGILRTVDLEKSPAGFYIDEAAIAAQVICVRQSGHDLMGKQTPLFSEVLGGGYATPATIYGGSAWTAVFGDSIGSFRAFSALHGLLTIAGVFFLALTLWRRQDISWLAAMCCALSPWGFIFSRIAWDPALAPAYFIWGLVFVLRPATSRLSMMFAVFGGMLLALACYSYPPLRMQALLLLPVIALIAFVAELKITDRAEVTPSRRFILMRYSLACVSFVVALIPLISLTVSGQLQGRFNVLSIANEQYLQQFGGYSPLLVGRLFFENMAMNLSPTYLFLTGDANVRHSTQAVGQWSWLEIFALIATFALLLKRKLVTNRRELIIFLALIWAYLSGVIPAAMTWESNPHALRSIGAYPFLALLAGFILAKACEQWRYIRFATLLIALGFSITYFGDFFLKFPERSRPWFDAATVESQGQLPADYAPLARQYYKLRSGEASCATNK